MSRYPLYRLAQWLGEVLPMQAGYWLAERVEDVWWRLSREDRRGVCANLSAVLKDHVAEDAPMVREVFRGFGRYLLEVLTVHRRAPRLLTVTGYDDLVRAQRAGQGVIMLTGHFGNWELAGVALSRMGFPISAVALSHRDPRVNRLFNAQRERCGIDVIPVGLQAGQGCLAALRRGRVLGIVADRDFGTEGVAVSFFGRPVIVPRGPATFSLRTGAPLMTCGMRRTGRWQFHFQIDPPVALAPSGEPSDAVQRLTQAYMERFERLIRQDPSQWLMFRSFADAVPGRDVR